MFREVISKYLDKRAVVVVSRINKFIANSKTVIEIGSGTGSVAKRLVENGKIVTPIDVLGFHGPRIVQTIIYDGKTIPFKENAFDTSLLLMVLHHTPDPELTISEAMKVGKEIVIIETSYASQITKFFTVILDTISNLQVKAYWDSYKSDAEWREIFKKKGLKIVESKKYPDKVLGLPFLHISYYLRKT